MTVTVQDWAAAVLKKIGAPLTRANLDFLHGWAGREGVPQSIDQFNWLGTTLPVGHSHGTNSVNVQSYTSFDDGVAAHARMLSQSNFSAIRTALQSGNPNAYKGSKQLQAEFRSWSGGGYSWPVSGKGGGSSLLGEAEHVAGASLGAAIPDPFHLFGAASDAVGGVVGGVGDVAGLIGRLTDPSYILRGLQIIAGGGLVAGGLLLLARQVGLASVMSSTPGPVGRVAGAVG